MKLTDEQIEKAARAAYVFEVSWLSAPDLWSDLTEESRDFWRSVARAALEAVMPGESVDCPECQGTGLRDTGGVHPWGEYILVPCDHSAAHPAPEPGEVERLRVENERLEKALKAYHENKAKGNREAIRAAILAALPEQPGSTLPRSKSH